MDLDRFDFGKVYIKHGIYEPIFEDGICKLITEKNNKFWVFCIDYYGNMLSEAVEIEDWQIIDYANKSYRPEIIVTPTP